jgi:hypothetical protein
MSIRLQWLLLLALPAVAADAPDLADVARRIVHGSNELRRADGQRELTVNTPLAEAARYFADVLSRGDNLSHTADGMRPEQRAERHGYAYCIVSENIAQQFSSEEFTAPALAEAFVQGWEHSPGHRRNLHHPEVMEIGVAVARNEQSGTYYAVQMFGLPTSQAVAFEIENRAALALSYTLGGKAFALPPSTTRTHRVCGSVALEVQLPGETTAISTTPRDGERYAIEPDGSGRPRWIRK